MKNRTWRAAGILGGALMLTISSGSLVQAAGTEEKENKEPSATSVLETIAWGNDAAAANVNTYANIRTEASLEGEKTGVLLKGAAGRVLGQEGEWTKIASGNVEGYVKTDLLVFGDEAKQLHGETYGNKGIVTTESLRIRKEPSLEGEKIGSGKKGNSFEILGQEGDWYQVEYNGNTGYMFGAYLDVNQQKALTVDEYHQKKEQEQKEAQQQKEAQESVAAVSAGSGDLDLLAAIIQCEAGGESHTGKVAVGAVIMNRIRSGSFPDSISEVVYQRGQFSPVASGKLASVLAQGAREDCYQAAREALAGSNPIGGCLYFNSGSGRGIQIGNQHFF